MALGSPHLLFQRCLRDRVSCLDFNLQAPCRPQSAIAVPITFPRGRTLPRHPPDRPCSHHRIRAHSWPHAKSRERVNWPPWRNRCQTAALQGFDTFPVSGPLCTSDLRTPARRCVPESPSGIVNGIRSRESRKKRHGHDNQGCFAGSTALIDRCGSGADFHCIPYPPPRRRCLAPMRFWVAAKQLLDADGIDIGLRVQQ